MQSVAKAQALVRDLADKLSKRLAGSSTINTVRLDKDAQGWPMIFCSNSGTETAGAAVVAIRIRNVDMVSKDIFGNSTFAYAPHILELSYELTPGTYTVTTANATTGAIYSNTAGENITVGSTLVTGTTLSVQGNLSNNPLSTSGTLTKISGTGDATITYTNFTGFNVIPNVADIARIKWEAQRTGVRYLEKPLSNTTAVSPTAMDSETALIDLEDMYWPTKSV